mmetsp:Transcript_3617/g.5403  ORF Transcript_3617/g.5403 Transcript_3617/m.5403 type:complete len:672 (-) Transcript_3617:219-2234(-)
MMLRVIYLSLFTIASALPPLSPSNARNNASLISHEDGSCIIQAAHFLPSEPGIVPKNFKGLRFDCEFDKRFVLPLDLDANQEKEMRGMLVDGRLVANYSMLVFNPPNANPTTSKQMEIKVVDESVRIPRGADMLAYIKTAPTPRPPAFHKEDGDPFFFFPAPKRALVIKVIDSDGDTVSETPAQLSDYVFGTGGDSITARSQLNACSYGKFDLKPESPEGLDSNTSAEGVIKVTIDIPFSSGKYAVESAVRDEAAKILGYELPGEAYDYVMISVKCYQYCNWAAYAYTNSWLSVFKNEFITQPGVILHELGHNFNLDHSGENESEYGDHTCLMGNSGSLYSTDGGRMCYNGAKNWQLGWYEEDGDKIDLDPNNRDGDDNWTGTLVGVSDYRNNPNGHAIVIRIRSGINKDLFVSLNRVKGINEQNIEAVDQVIIVETHGNGGDGFSQSWLKGKLSEGGMWRSNGTFGNTGEVLSISAPAIDLAAKPGYADVHICLGSMCGFPSISPVPTNKMSLTPTLEPTTSSHPTMKATCSSSLGDANYPGGGVSNVYATGGDMFDVTAVKDVVVTQISFFGGNTLNYVLYKKIGLGPFELDDRSNQSAWEHFASGTPETTQFHMLQRLNTASVSIPSGSTHAFSIHVIGHAAIAIYEGNYSDIMYENDDMQISCGAVN